MPGLGRVTPVPMPLSMSAKIEPLPCFDFVHEVLKNVGFFRYLAPTPNHPADFFDYPPDGTLRQAGDGTAFFLVFEREAVRLCAGGSGGDQGSQICRLGSRGAARQLEHARSDPAVYLAVFRALDVSHQRR